MLRHYRRSWLRGDLIAGLTVAAYLIPQVMAYATVAGLDPVAGLWAALPALVVYAFLGSSPSLSMGPEATTALMTAIAICPICTCKICGCCSCPRSACWSWGSAMTC